MDFVPYLTLTRLITGLSGIHNYTRNLLRTIPDMLLTISVL